MSYIIYYIHIVLYIIYHISYIIFYLKADASAAGPKWIGSSIFSRLFFWLFVHLNLKEFLLNWFDICQIMLRYWLQRGEKSRSGGILGGLGDLSEAMLKMACLGSCWSYVGTSLAAGWLPRSSFRRLRMPKWAKMVRKGLQNWAKMASWAQNSRSGGLWGGPGGLLEAILNDVGSKLACLGSCWSYVATFLATRWLPRWPSWRSRVPRWAKMAPKRLPNWVKMASWARNSKLLLQFWYHFSCFLVE